MPGRFKFILKWTNLYLVIDKNLKFLPKFFLRKCGRKKFNSESENKNYEHVHFCIHQISVMNTQRVNTMGIFLVALKDLIALDTMNLIYSGYLYNCLYSENNVLTISMNHYYVDL
jgi:hypothetical protein